MDQAEIEHFYSDEAQDIIGKEPTWVIKRGMFVLALIILTLLCACFFLQYHEIVIIPVTIKMNPLGVYETKASVDLVTAHKVKVGQKGLIQLTEFPANDYGQLYANVIGISDGEMDSVYIVDIRLENGLTTSSKRKIKWKQIYYGRISIVVERTTIFRKIFAKLYSTVH